MTDKIIGQTGHTLILGPSGHYQGPIALHLAAQAVKEGQHVFILCHSEAEANIIRRILWLSQRLEPSFETARYHIVSGFTRHAHAELIAPLVEREMIESHLGEALVFRDLSTEPIPLTANDVALQAQHVLASYGRSLTSISICGSGPLPDFAPYAAHADTVFVCKDSGSEVSLTSEKPQEPSTVHRFIRRTARGLVTFEDMEIADAE